MLIFVVYFNAMHFLPEELDAYVVNHSEDEPSLLQQRIRKFYNPLC